jgi:putative hydrolase of the HAD superfamily
LFDGVITAAMAGAAKPASQVFEMAVRAGGASKAETLHIGDQPLHDVEGARAAGLRTAWINRNGAEWPDEYARPDMEVVHVGEILALLTVD